MNIGSVELHGASAPFPRSDGELRSKDPSSAPLSLGIAHHHRHDNNSPNSSVSSLLKPPLKPSTLQDHPFKKPSMEKGSVEKPLTKNTPEDAEDKKARRKKKWKKPKDKPNRPLSAYNLFFAEERARMLGDDAPTPEQEALKKRVHCKTHGKIGFAVMARTIGAKWKALEREKKKVFENMARKEKDRYLVQLAAWKEAQKDKKSLEEQESDASNKGVDVVPTAAFGSGPMNVDAIAATGKNFMNPLQGPKHATESMRLLLENRMHRRNMSCLQAAPQGEYIRAMQDRPIDQAAFYSMAGPSGFQQQQMMMQHQQQYPNAAEASANTLLNHFQQGFPTPHVPSQTQAAMFDRELFQEYAAMRRLQQRFMAGGYGMNMNGMNSMNGSMNGNQNF